MRVKKIGSPFEGPITAADPRSIPERAAQDMLNVRIADGKLNTRYGFNNLRAAQANVSAVYGADYVQGYSGTSEVEEYITFESISGTTKPFSRAVAGTAAPTEITNAGVALDLHDSSWLSVPWGSYAYCINPNQTTSIYRHVIGTATSFLPVAIPTAPATALTYEKIYPTSAGYSVQNYNGINVATHITYDAPCTATNSSVTSNDELIIAHSALSDGYWEVDWQADKDWTSYDIFYFTMTPLASGTRFDPGSVQVIFTNADGSPLTFNGTVTVAKQSTGVGGAGDTWGVRIEFDKTDRTKWDNIRKMRVRYTMTSNSGTSQIRFSAMTLGGVNYLAPFDYPVTMPGTTFAYSYYNSTNDWESGLSPTRLTIPTNVVRGPSAGIGLGGLGVHIRLTMTDSADSTVDQYRVYVFDNVGRNFHRLTTQSDGTDTYDVKTGYSEWIALTKYRTVTPFKSDKCINAFAHKGVMCWLYQGGSDNVRWSRVGDPERQAAPEIDVLEDENRGRTMSLASNSGDEPLCGFSCGDVVIVLGNQGAYASVGDAPFLMTPFKKLAGSFGCANKFAATRWKTDAGVPGVAFVSKDGQIYFAAADPSLQGDDGSAILKLSQAIETGSLSPSTFLMTGQSLTDFTTCRMGVDQATDSLWVVMGKRALVLRKNWKGERYWEAYEYSIGSTTWSFLAFSLKRRLRVCRSDGKFDELEWNTASGAYITGASRDGGSAVGTPYWRSKTLRSEPRRAMRAFLVRDSLSDTPAITVYSERTTGGNTYYLDPNRQSTRLGITNQGREFSYKITLDENSSAVDLLEIEETIAGRRPSY